MFGVPMGTKKRSPQTGVLLQPSSLRRIPQQSPLRPLPHEGSTPNTCCVASQHAFGVEPSCGSSRSGLCCGIRRSEFGCSSNHSGLRWISKDYKSLLWPLGISLPPNQANLWGYTTLRMRPSIELDCETEYLAVKPAPCRLSSAVKSAPCRPESSLPLKGNGEAAGACRR